VLYVGKAISLKKRLLSYFGRDLNSKTVALMQQAADIEYRLTPTESMALILEAGLIREHKPKYNISLRDDKSFPMVKITHEEFPAIYVTRKKEDDGARYFGPYTSASLLRDALKIIRRTFPYRSCRNLPHKACIYYRLNLSPGPCVGKITREEYARIIEDISLVLQGKTETLIKSLSSKMHDKANARDFEEAAKIRDQINALSSLGHSYTPSGSQIELEDLKRLLKTDKLVQRIEAFDISNIYGKEATGSMVSFFRGIADKNGYRKFRIKGVEGIDDYGMIREVVRRRYSRVLEEKLPLPDLILIDGGKGHLLSAQKELKELGLKVPLISIAKEKENIYISGRQSPLNFKSDTPALNLIRRVRDEAHRFAVAYHHLLRKKRIVGRGR
ncbi:MAG TPA: excinuclease ABC subunit UvrC, partial [Candidatus Margulisiibacteriota bacterium]|nr:excinuclease ABC subunit UvrC [Candidatus Margulisiibacteriota bacterium]